MALIQLFLPDTTEEAGNTPSKNGSLCNRFLMSNVFPVLPSAPLYF